jgi:hypothetical protein
MPRNCLKILVIGVLAWHAQPSYARTPTGGLDAFIDSCVYPRLEGVQPDYARLISQFPQSAPTENNADSPDKYFDPETKATLHISRNGVCKISYSESTKQSAIEGLRPMLRRLMSKYYEDTIGEPVEEGSTRPHMEALWMRGPASSLDVTLITTDGANGFEIVVYTTAPQPVRK